MAQARPRRSQGLGNIRPHGDGRWRLSVSAGTDPLTGKRRQITKVVTGTKAEAELALAELRIAVAGGHVPAGDKCFGDALDAFLDHKADSVEPSTLALWRDSISYIPDRLRIKPLARVDVELLEEIYRALARRGNKRTGGGLAPATIRNVHVAIYGTFELARRRRWVAVNPAVDAETPKVRRRLPSPLPADAIPALLASAAAEHETLPTYLRVSICAGGRRGEVHGLRWSGVDFARSLVVLRDTVTITAGTLAVKPYTKTGGQRTVHVDPGTLEHLRVLHDRAFTNALACGVALPVGAFVFSDAATGDRPWNPNTTMRRFKRAATAAGLPASTRLHDLRHLMATHLIDAGVPIPVVSARLGHSQNSTTLDIYTGRRAASDVAAAEVMGRLLHPPNKADT